MYVVVPALPTENAEADWMRGDVVCTTREADAIAVARNYAKTQGRDFRVYKLVEDAYLKGLPNGMVG
jgi:hypothetical protein